SQGAKRIPGTHPSYAETRSAFRTSHCAGGPLLSSGPDRCLGLLFAGTLSWSSQRIQTPCCPGLRDQTGGPVVAPAKRTRETLGGRPLAILGRIAHDGVRGTRARSEIQRPETYAPGPPKRRPY